MNATEIIDQVLARDDNISPTDADNTTRRQRLLEYLREVEAEVWWRRDWTWKKKRDTVTIAAGLGYGVVPYDFASLGMYGGVYLPRSGGVGDGAKLELKPESVITDLRESGYNSSQPTVFALFGQDPDTYLQYLQTTNAASEQTLAIWYQPNPPYIDEVVGLAPLTDIAMTSVSGRSGIITTAGGDFTTQFLGAKAVLVSGFANTLNNGEFEITGTVTSGAMPVQKRSPDTLVAEAAGASVTLTGHVENIKQIPEKYHQLVIVVGLRAKARESKGDARWQTEVAAYEKGMLWMQSEENRFQGEYRQLPSFFGRPSF